MAAMTVVCPHCASVMRLKDSDTKKSIRFKRIKFVCDKPECSYAELWHLTPAWELSPSGTPSKEYDIELSPHIKQPQVGA